MKHTQSLGPNIELSSLWEEAAKDAAALVAHAEEQYEGRLREAADQAVERGVRVLLVSGPSASGKTTTAFKLSDLLARRGISAPVVSLDDFFIGVNEYPRLPDGTPDFESIHCLDIELLTITVRGLLRYGRADFPLYDFTTGTRSDEVREICLRERDILIVEGIHSLNPLISERLPQGVALKVYVSIESSFTDGGRVVLTPQDTRLIRRMTRDNFYRNYPPHMTLDRWQHVLDGEKKYIEPFHHQADMHLNTVLRYEPCVFGHYLLPALHGEELSRHDRKLLALREALASFPTLGREMIPQTSLLREFVSDEG